MKTLGMFPGSRKKVLDKSASIHKSRVRQTLPTHYCSYTMTTVQPDAKRVQKYLTRIKEQDASPHPYILHYDIESGTLRPWLWSVEVFPFIPSVLKKFDIGPKTRQVKR